jgi:cholest-4-en-3-one 26-monooxygenase
MTKSTIAGIDLNDPDQFADGVPHETFARLRREAPVSWCEEVDGPGFWSVVRHADVQTVNRDYESFSSAQGVSIPDWTDEERAGSASMMLHMDPTKHTRYRLLVNKGFTPRMIGKLAESLAVRARTIVDDVIERGECDFVQDIAAELPVQAIADIMGVPMEDRHRLRDWANHLTGSQDPEFNASEDDTQQARAEMWQYANELAAEKRANPSDDIISALVNAEIEFEGEKHQLSELEFDVFFMLLAVAGTETTRNVVGLGLDAFFERPGLWDQLVANPALLDTAVEEMIRWVTPVMYFRRTATRDREIAGERIAAGDKVVIWYSSANRDEDVFTAPDAFDITRTPNEHVTFGGGGPHFCLGANLARMEVRLVFDEVIRRLPDLRPAGPARLLRSSQINGIKHLPVEFTPGRRSTV